MEVDTTTAKDASNGVDTAVSTAGGVDSAPVVVSDAPTSTAPTTTSIPSAIPSAVPKDTPSEQPPNASAGAKDTPSEQPNNPDPHSANTPAPPPSKYVPNPGPSGRGFTVSHQKVALEISLTSAVVLGGYTELTIVPTDEYLQTIYLNLRQCNVSSVTCSGHKAQYQVLDHLTNITLSDPRDVHLYPEYKRKLFAASTDGQGGEMSITLPSQVKIEHAESSSASSDLAPITIRIDYTLTNPIDAIQCIRPSQDSPWKLPHLYTSPTCPDFARCWVPCVDSLWERNTWEFQFIVPAKIQADTLRDTIVACTGDLVEKTVHPHHSNKLIYSFLQAAPTSVQHIAFAVGPFHVLDLSEKAVAAPIAPQSNTAANGTSTTTNEAAANDSATAQDDSGELQILAFCLPGRQAELQTTIGVAKQAMDYYSREFGSYPFGSYKAIFVEDALIDVHSASTVSLFSSDLLHPPSVVDQALATRQVIAHALATQWVGINIIQKSWSDTWVIHGLSLYIAGLFWRRLMGNNEYRFRLRKDCDRVCAWDIGMPPLCQVGMPEPPDANLLPFINLKAPLVMHILDKRLCKAGASLGLGRVIPKVFLQAITGELPNNTLSTSSFLRTCRKVSTVDLRTFADQWIYKSGCPHFYIRSIFNRKKLTIEITVRQDLPSAHYSDHRPELALGSNPARLFEGQMTIRINEADGRPYEHVLDIKEPVKRYDVPFNTKYKRVRRNTKRFQARQAAAAAAAEGDQEAAEAMGMIDLGFSLAMWENEEQRDRWKVADWTEKDEIIMSQAAYEWIRMDSDFEWIAQLHVEQPDYMWVSQLQRDRDVVAQLQAVQALTQTPNRVSCSMLTRTVLVSKYFFRIRTEAVMAIVQCAIPELGYLGLFHLLMLFKAAYCIDIPDSEQPLEPLDLICIPKANDFSDPAEYFVKKALINAISRVRNEAGRTLPQVKKFLINQLRYNDNSINRFVDDYYVASLISCITNAFLPVESRARGGGYVPASDDPDARDDATLFQHAHSEITRLQELDKLVPSFHNLITLSCLDWQSAMVLISQLPLDLSMYLAYTQQGTFTPVRISAFKHLLILSGLKHRIITRYIFAVLRSDQDRVLKRALAKAVCEGVAIAIATDGESRAGLLQESNGLDPESIDRAKDRDMESALRALRKEVGRSAAVREGFLGALLSPDADLEQRWALIKLAELLFKPGQEQELPLQQYLSSTATNTAKNSATGAAGQSATSAAAKIKLVSRGSGIGLSASNEDSVSGASSSQRVVAFDAPDDSVRLQKKKTYSHPTVKLKKPKPVAQAQAAGMTQTDLTACRNALKKIQASRHATMFIHPVDPVRDGAPNYHKIIKEPMDLSTMENKLEAGLYADRFAFEKDFELLVRNAKTYTPDPTAFVHKEAEALHKAFTTLWTKTTKTLEQAAAKQARSAAGEEEEAQQPASSQQGVMAPPPVPVRASSSSKATPSAASPPAPSTPSVAKPLGLKLKLKSRSSVGAPAVSSPPPPSAAKPAPTVANVNAGGDDGEAEVSDALSPPPKNKSKPPKIKKPSLANGISTFSSMASSSSSSASSSSSSSNAGSTSAVAPAPSSSAPAPELAGTESIGGVTLSLPTGGPEDPVNIGMGEPIHTKQCKALLANLKRLPEAFLFLAPVDEAYAPGYFSIVHYPMDLGTMETKLTSGKYSTMDEFAGDMEQIFQNAYLYADTTAVSYAAVLRDAFVQKEWPKAMIRRLEYSEKRTLQGLLSRIKSNPTGGLFIQPISEIVKALPHYHDVIPKAESRDLSMIGDKLKMDKYGSVSEFDTDMKLMVANARKFNGTNQGILDLVDAFETLYNREMKGVGLVVNTKKRKDDGNGSASDAKRFKQQAARLN
ncbi:unnamed protein product [Sympodiomycopsis kandeliae]